MRESGYWCTAKHVRHWESMKWKACCGTMGWRRALCHSVSILITIKDSFNLPKLVCLNMLMCGTYASLCLTCSSPVSQQQSDIFEAAAVCFSRCPNCWKMFVYGEESSQKKPLLNKNSNHGSKRLNVFSLTIELCLRVCCEGKELWIFSKHDALPWRTKQHGHRSNSRVGTIHKEWLV